MIFISYNPNISESHCKNKQVVIIRRCLFMFQMTATIELVFVCCTTLCSFHNVYSIGILFFCSVHQILLESTIMNINSNMTVSLLFVIHFDAHSKFMFSWWARHTKNASANVKCEQKMNESNSVQGERNGTFFASIFQYLSWNIPWLHSQKYSLFLCLFCRINHLLYELCGLWWISLLWIVRNA